MKYILDIVYAAAFLVYLPKVLYRRLFEDRYTDGFAQRLGYISKHGNKPKCIWIHSVSVGEVNATKTLVEKLETDLPDVEIVMSTTTDTGYARAKALYGDKMSIFYYPLDFSWAVRRGFDKINPDLCLLVELEVWPNFASEAKSRNIPLLVFNGRLSDNSFPRYKLIKPITKKMFANVSMFLVQTEEYKQRFIELGTDKQKITVTGSVKYDTAAITDVVEGSRQLADSLSISDNQRLFVAGGTGSGEEEIIIDVFKKLKPDFNNLRLAIVPRKPERFDEVAALIQKQQLPLIRYSNIKNSSQKIDIPADSVILCDTMGDLKKFYSLAEIVFVGRSMCPMGGSDMMESTAMGKFTTFGVHTFNFKQTVDALLNADGAVEVENAQQLEAVLHKALCDDQYKDKIASNGKQVIAENQGATEKSVKIIKQYLESC